MKISIISEASDICKVDVLRNEPDRVDILINSTKDDFAKKESVELGSVDTGATVELGGREYVVLDHDFIFWGGSHLLSKDIVSYMEFGKDRDFRESDVYKFLNNDFWKELSAIVGKDNVLPNFMSLKALDGTDIDLDSYKAAGDCIAVKIGLLTLDDFRLYKRLIPDTEGDYWLATPFSWAAPEYRDCVCCVASGGVPGWYYGSWGSLGVRPYFALKNSVKVNLCED